MFNDARAYPGSVYDVKKKLPPKKKPPVKGPWLQSILGAMARSKQFVMSMTPNADVVVTNASAIFHGYGGLGPLVTSLQAAVQGSSRKSVVQGALNANVFNATAGTAAAGFPCWGWKLRLTGSVNNFAYRPITVNVGPVLNTAGTLSIPNPVVTFIVYPRRLPMDVMVLSPSNAGGIMTVSPGMQDEVVAASATSATNGVQIESLSDANTFAAIESLNARDLIVRPGVRVGGVLYDASAFGNPWDGEGPDSYFEGLRDDE